MSDQKLYPLMFTPCYQFIMWGGNTIAALPGRTVPPLAGNPVGEAWEICDRPDAESIVENGGLRGQSLSALLAARGTEIMGDNFTGGRFPLLVKIIDAAKRLSLQVHPDAAACEQLGHGAEPKTEMWYLLQSAAGAKIFAGLRPGTSRADFLNHLHDPEIENRLRVYPARPGDAFFIKAGTVHAIGEGNLIWEIQQNSGTTYRFSDWGRVDGNGKRRELHTQEAEASAHFEEASEPLVPGVCGQRPAELVNCPFFLVCEHQLSARRRATTGGLCHLLTAVNAGITVCAGGTEVRVERGRTCMIPAILDQYEVIPDTDSTVVLDTTVPV